MWPTWWASTRVKAWWDGLHVLLRGWILDPQLMGGSWILSTWVDPGSSVTHTILVPKGQGRLGQVDEAEVCTLGLPSRILGPVVLCTTDLLRSWLNRVCWSLRMHGPAWARPPPAHT